MTFLRRVWRFRRAERPYIFLGVLCLLAGISGMVEGLEESTIGSQLGLWAQRVWLALYALGGLFTLAGTMWPRHSRPEWESLGLCTILGGMGINAVIVLWLRGPVVGGTTLLSILFATWMVQGRLVELRSGERRR